MNDERKHLRLVPPLSPEALLAAEETERQALSGNNYPQPVRQVEEHDNDSGDDEADRASLDSAYATQPALGVEPVAVAVQRAPTGEALSVHDYKVAKFLGSIALLVGLVGGGAEAVGAHSTAAGIFEVSAFYATGAAIAAGYESFSRIISRQNRSK